jgi:hypothetical protein
MMEAQVAIPILPPRPDAITTLLTSDDYLPGAQTLLYSIKVSAARRCHVNLCVLVSVTYALFSRPNHSWFSVVETKV